MNNGQFSTMRNSSFFPSSLLCGLCTQYTFICDIDNWSHLALHVLLFYLRYDFTCHAIFSFPIYFNIADHIIITYKNITKSNTDFRITMNF